MQNSIGVRNWRSQEAIKKWINNSLNSTSVTIVLIGAETASREWVNYEIEQSHNRGNGLLGIYLHNIKNSAGYTDIKGTNPFTNWQITTNDGLVRSLSELYPTYDWVVERGYDNLGLWVEQAARQRGK